MIKRALISVWNKNGIVEFARRLYDKGIEILSTGGTAKLLRTNDIDVVEVSDYIDFPELASGVKTMHPKIHGALLAQRDSSAQMKEAQKNDIPMIDLLVSNFRPFDLSSSDIGKEPSEALGQLDIGGPSLLRSAATNFKSVTVVFDPSDYNLVAQEIEANGKTNIATRRRLAEKVFETVAHYDCQIVEYLTAGRTRHFAFHKLTDLRYGENPHQKAALYRDLHPSPRFACLPNALALQGKLLSYNNVIDADVALNLVRKFDQPCVAFVKHGNPCGIAIGEDLNDAFINAYQGDPKCVRGGVLAINRRCSADLAEILASKDFCVVLAPDYEERALIYFQGKNTLTVLKLGEVQPEALDHPLYKIAGGLLIQESDTKSLTESQLTVVTQKEPNSTQKKDLLFAWTIAKHTKTNAVVAAKKGMAVGIGAGQTSREEAVDLCLRKAQGRLKGAVLASDGYLDNPATIERMAQSGITAILQPGGSPNDPAIIAVADSHGIVMAFTGLRAFSH